MSAPPPQADVIVAALAWNYLRSRRGQVTISQWSREHKVAACAVVIGTCIWLVPHLARG